MRAPLALSDGGREGRVTLTAVAPHAQPADEVARALHADPRRGLTSEEARLRLARYGPNRPRARAGPPYLRLLLGQLLDPLVALLAGAAVVSIAIGDRVEGAAIAAIVVVNGALGFLQELAAERAVIALRSSFTTTAVVVRDGDAVAIPAEQVVPGDLLVLREGDRVAADSRLVEAHGVQADESALTGESLPVDKDVEPVAEAAALADRSSMLYAGTSVTRGRALAVVLATGEATELGEIDRLTAEAKPPPTPLQQQLGALARQMVLVGVLLTLGLAGAMLLRGSSFHSAFLVGVAVAVAAVPEGLAATLTAALALGSRAMAGRGAIVRRLEAIETIGETTVVCTDKTGTLTENRIRIAALRPVEGVDERDLLAAAVLASAAELAVGDEPQVLGDPIEGALLLAALERGISRHELLAERRHVLELPFDSDRRRMTVAYDEGDSLRAYTKGAPEAVAELLVRGDPGLDRVVEEWAAEGFRVLVIAARHLQMDEPLGDSIESGLRPLGAIALHDPLRETAAEVVEGALRAGLEVRMLTGDHPATALNIGRALGLDPDAVVARATPADKLRLVEELQTRGHVVAVTGDGVNDAPALRRADVGVAMGRSGTEAAHEAAGIVLTDDDFATLVAAIREGRRIGDNIRSFVAFLLSANLGEVLLFAVAIVVGLGAPLAVIQVLLVNLVTDGFPAIALASDPASPETMTRPPRRSRTLFGRRAWTGLALVGAAVGASGLAAYLIGHRVGTGEAQTMAYATIALAELALVFAIRIPTLPAWRAGRNPWLLWGVATSLFVVLATVYFPPLHEPARTVSLDQTQMLVVVALALAPFALVEAAKAWRARRLAARRGARPGSERAST